MPVPRQRRAVPTSRVIHGKTAPHGRRDKLTMRFGSWKRARRLVPASQRLARVSEPRRKGSAGPVKETVTLKYGGHISPQEAARQEKFAQAARERELLEMDTGRFQELVRDKLEYLRRMRSDQRAETYWARLGPMEERMGRSGVSMSLREDAIKQILYTERLEAELGEEPAAPRPSSRGLTMRWTELSRLQPDDMITQMRTQYEAVKLRLPRNIASFAESELRALERSKGIASWSMEWISDAEKREMARDLFSVMQENL